MAATPLTTEKKAAAEKPKGKLVVLRKARAL